MGQLPEKVAETLTELKKKHPHSLSVKFIRNGYYVYEEYTKWDRLLKRRISYGIYLGKIEEDGKLVPPRRKNQRTAGIKTIEGYIKNRDKEAAEQNKAVENDENIRILSALSANARISMEEIGKKVGLLGQTVNYRVKNLEKKYDIKYTIDTYAAFNFGFYRYLITVKFKDQKPDLEGIKKVLEKEPRVQLAVSAKGEFDLLIYVLFENPTVLENWLYALRKDEIFSAYRSVWNVSYFLIGHGVIPLRDEFFDIIKERVWHRTKETPRRRYGEIFQREYAVLRALNKNGIEKFNDIDKEYGLRKGIADYTFHELVDKNVIRRVTISMQNLPIKYLAIIEVKQVNMKRFFESRKEYLLYFLKENDMLTNKFPIIGDMGSPYGSFIILSVYDDGDLEKTEEDLKRIVKGVEIRTTIISSVILGSICMNKLETKQINLYNLLINEYKMSEEEIFRFLYKKEL